MKREQEKDKQKPMGNPQRSGSERPEKQRGNPERGENEDLPGRQPDGAPYIGDDPEEIKKQSPKTK